MAIRMKSAEPARTDISVIIPTFNRRHLLEQAIGSALGLSPEASIEVLVVDDCSTDDSWAWLRANKTAATRAFRTDRNFGQCGARNLAMQKAVGDYLLFLDSDDVLEPAAILEGLRVAKGSGADITVFGWGTVTVDEGGLADVSSRHTSPAPLFSAAIIDDVLAGRAVPTSAALYRRQHVQSNRWDETLRKLDDWDWFCQAALLGGRIVTVDDVAYWMRSHAGARVTTTASMLLNAREHHAILAKIEAWLRANGELTEARSMRLAQYYYKELRVLSLHDVPAFEAAVVHILELDPRFAPRDEERQWWMRVGARLLGVRRAIEWHSALKRRIRRTAQGG